MWSKLRALMFILPYCGGAFLCPDEQKPADHCSICPIHPSHILHLPVWLYLNESCYFLRFDNHMAREEYLQCIKQKGTNIVFYGNYTGYGHILRTHYDCFKQPELDNLKYLKRMFRDYETLHYYIDAEYDQCSNGTEVTLQRELTNMKYDFHINITCLNAFKQRVENFQVKSYPWVMGFEITLMAVLLLLGVPANALLLLVLWRHKDLHTTANIFIANLAIADLMNISVYAPLSFLNYVQFDESYGDIICKCMMSACDLFMIVSVYTFICMSAYRYLGIRNLVAKSGDRIKFTKRGALIAVGLVWVLAFTLCSHSAIGAGVVAKHCFFVLSHDGYIHRRMTEIVIIFLAPFAAITYLCVATSVLLRRSAGHIPGENQGTAIAARKRTANVPIKLIIQFFICHVFRLTFLVVDLWSRYSFYSGVNQGLFCFLLLYFIFSAFLTYFHSCLPPIMLFFTSSNIKNNLKASVKKWFGQDASSKQPAATKRDVKKKS